MQSSGNLSRLLSEKGVAQVRDEVIEGWDSLWNSHLSHTQCVISPSHFSQRNASWAKLQHRGACLVQRRGAVSLSVAEAGCLW